MSTTAEKFTSDRKLAVVTGASSGIGEATARELAKLGYHVIVAARRLERLEALAKEIDGTAVELDVTKVEDSAALAERLDGSPLYLLVNNAGGALGMESIEDANIDHWRWMWETNVLGTLNVTRALLPALRRSADALITTVTSTAGIEPYDFGGGYTSSKHAESVLHRTLRGELLGEPIRLTEILPGAVNTDFSTVRFDGDKARADAVYEGYEPLVAQDIAEVIGFVATRPAHVDLDQIVIKPRAQASITGQRIARAPKNPDPEK